jgi:GNAT superfamily N-acetyltransferase
MAEFRVELRSWEEARTVAGPIRFAVFEETQDEAAGVDLDDLDAQSVHAIAFDPLGNGLGTGRLQPDGQIGRLVVLKDWRRLGVGAALLGALIEEARKRGRADVTVSAPLRAAEFYREQGFVADGKVFKQGTTLQQKMRKPLK